MTRRWMAVFSRGPCRTTGVGRLDALADSGGPQYFLSSSPIVIAAVQADGEFTRRTLSPLVHRLLRCSINAAVVSCGAFRQPVLWNHASARGGV